MQYFSFYSLFIIIFRSVVSYDVTKLPLLSISTVASADNLSSYDSVDDDVITSYNEFALASLIFFGMKEGAASEQSARMTAMDGASKNAGMFRVCPSVIVAGSACNLSSRCYAISYSRSKTC